MPESLSGLWYAKFMDTVRQHPASVALQESAQQRSYQNGRER